MLEVNTVNNRPLGGRWRSVVAQDKIMGGPDWRDCDEEYGQTESVIKITHARELY